MRDLWPELPREMGVIRNPLVLAMGVLEWLLHHSARRLVGLSPGIVAGIERRGIPMPSAHAGTQRLATWNCSSTRRSRGVP